MNNQTSIGMFKTMRRIRNAINAETVGMTFEQERAYPDQFYLISLPKNHLHLTSVLPERKLELSREG